MGGRLYWLDDTKELIDVCSAGGEPNLTTRADGGMLGKDAPLLLVK
jgi:hypothetical protein